MSKNKEKNKEKSKQKKKKNKQKNTSLNKNIDMKEKKGAGKNDSDKGSDIKKEKKSDNGSDVKAGKVSDNNIAGSETGKNIIRQGNKLIFSDTAANDTKDTAASAGNKASTNAADFSEAALNDAASDSQQNTDKGSFFENKLELAVMSKKERRAAKKAAFREYTSKMTGKERVSYFFYCYKWHIIIPICCILLIACYCAAFYRNSRPVALSYTVLNAEEFDKTFHEDYLSYFNLPEDHVVQATAGYFVNYDYYKKNTVSATREGSNYSTLALTCQSGTFDVIIGDGAGIKYCTYVEIVKPLDLYFSEEQYAALEDYVVKFQDSSYTFYPYAIDISDTEFAKNLNLEYSKVYMAFPGVSEENMTNSLRLLEYVLGIDLAE